MVIGGAVWWPKEETEPSGRNCCSAYRGVAFKGLVGAAFNAPFFADPGSAYVIEFGRPVLASVFDTRKFAGTRNDVEVPARARTRTFEEPESSAKYRLSEYYRLAHALSQFKRVAQAIEIECSAYAIGTKDRGGCPSCWKSATS